MTQIGRNEPSLFDRLKASCAADWSAYTGHDFVRRLADGSLPEASFRHYLGQDYLFLIQFARAYALAIYKSDDIAGMREALQSLKTILDSEMSLHVGYCASWGLSEADMVQLPEATATMSYTRFVLERGMAGDVLDLHAALAPCVVGYAEIGRALLADPRTRLDGNPYRTWIETYGGADYQLVAVRAIDRLERLLHERAGPGREKSLASTFAKATRLEVAFWQMGLDQAL